MTFAYPSDASMARIAAGIIDNSLPKAEWTHAAHFAAALWLLRNQPDFLGPRDMPAIIRSYNDATSTPNTDAGGYHETITLASLRVAAAALLAAPDTPLHEILDEMLAGPQGRSDWLLRHWTRDWLFSVAARRTWLEPDLLPLG